MCRFQRTIMLGILAILTTVLSACGGSDSATTDVPEASGPEEPVVVAASVSAQDTTAAVYQNQAGIVNLANAIVTSDGSKPVLQSVSAVSDDPQCADISIDDLGFTLDATVPGSCLYQYQAADSSLQNTATAYTQVAISGEGAPLVSTNLATISKAIEIGEEVVITLDAPSNMTLSTDITVLGKGSVVNIDPTANTITFQAGSNDEDAGVTRLHYHYEGDDGLVIMGVIDIAISTDTFNQVPVALDWQYILSDDYNDGHSNTLVTEGALVTIDLTDVLLPDGSQGSLISDPDTDNSLQLIHVRAFNAEVTLVDAEDFDNVSFTFKAATAGRYNVTYQVSDHHGGYAIGIIEFLVQGTWPDVIVEETKDVFKAPVSLEAATIGDYDVAGIASEAPTPAGNGYDNVPTYTWEAASAICRARGGSLPTLEQAAAFLEQEQNPFIAGDGNDFEMASNWPVERAYFTSELQDGDPSKAIAMFAKSDQFYFDGVDAGVDGNNTPYLGYLFCIDKTPQSLKIDNSTLLKDVENQRLTASFETASGLSFPYTKPLYWSVSTPTDNTLEAMPDIASNVTLNKYSGEFNALATGYINITAETPLGELSTSKNINVIEDLLASVGLDGTFDNFEKDGRCLTYEEGDSSVIATYGDNSYEGVDGTGFSIKGDDYPITRVTSKCGEFRPDTQNPSGYVRMSAGNGNAADYTDLHTTYLSGTGVAHGIELKAGTRYKFGTWLRVYSGVTGPTLRSNLRVLAVQFNNKSYIGSAGPTIEMSCTLYQTDKVTDVNYGPSVKSKISLGSPPIRALTRAWTDETQETPYEGNLTDWHYVTCDMGEPDNDVTGYFSLGISAGKTIFTVEIDNMSVIPITD